MSRTIDSATFKECLALLGWTHAEAARQLRVHSRQRVGDWASNRRPVPAYVAGALSRAVDEALRKSGL